MTESSPSIALIEQLSKLVPKLASGDNKEAKNQAIQLSRQLTGSLSHPASAAVELAFAVNCDETHPYCLERTNSSKSQPFITVAARIAIGMGLFKLIVDNDGPISSKKLAEESGGEELLISKKNSQSIDLRYTLTSMFAVRTLRPLASVGVVRETGERQWEPTPVTHAMATEEISAGHRMM